MTKDNVNGEPKKALVTIWCKIYTNNFSEELIGKTATGQEIYDFLMKDSGNCFDENGNVIPGDCNLWYLGCNEKFGELTYNDLTLRWHFGESSFFNVTKFISAAYKDGLFTADQYDMLLFKVLEGLQCKDMYQIKDYLIRRQKEMDQAPAEKARVCA
jgi:hypothetical protein